VRPREQRGRPRPYTFRMSEEMSIRVNFSRPVALFPIDGLVLLPQQVLPLHIFEPRYRQMVSDALDSAGQIAMATFKGESWKQDYEGRPPLMPAVCVGQIVQHESRPDGRYNILIQGVCRAKIVREVLPDDPEMEVYDEEPKLYRRAELEPVGLDSEPEEDLEALRTRVKMSLENGPLARMAVAEQVLEYVENDEVPTPALLELISFSLLTDPKLRYQLLEEGDINRRAEMIDTSIDHLESLIRRALAQKPEEWPKGVSWN